MYLATQSDWNEDFKTQFRSNILPQINDYGRWNTQTLTSVGDDQIITKWQEVPADVILQSLLMVQHYFAAECVRGRAGVGNYQLK